ncbi:MAG TPA: hypothetical protein VLA12_05185 [Planctomycetaceae bacterium]|nr:hypothetical protein [Planctomycetaceae bacterium]
MQENSSDEDSSDHLGKLLEKFSTKTQVVGAWIGSVVLAIAGGIIIWKADAIGAAMEATGYDIGGWVLIGVAGCVAFYAFLMSGKEFQVRSKGVRFRSGQKTKEMLWQDIRDITFTRIETIDPQAHFNQVKISWKIVLQTDDQTIYLKESFLNQTGNVSGLMTLLKLHCDDSLKEKFPSKESMIGLRGGGEDHLDLETRGMMEMAQVLKEKRKQKEQEERSSAPVAAIPLAGDEPAKPQPQPQPQPQKASPGGMDLPRAVAQKLKSGVPAPKIMAWLEQKQGMPKPVAAKILEKAIALLEE